MQNLEDPDLGEETICEGDPDDKELAEALEFEYQLYKKYGYETGKVKTRRRRSMTLHALQSVANFVTLKEYPKISGSKPAVYQESNLVPVN